jgi:diguanylate cyclase (GGDEF)-like protein
MVTACVSDAELQHLKARISDLELSLLTATEHGDLLQEHLYRTSHQLAIEVRERQAAEFKLHRLLEAAKQEKSDLEIMLQILIEQGDYSAAEGEQARIDGLTRVANRRRLDEHLLKEWERHRLSQQPLSLLLCDIDHFKSYNDQYGHLAGDDCLRRVGELIGQSVRSNDLVARYGGEEFAVLLPQTDLHTAIVIAERTRSVLAGAALPHSTSSNGRILTISIGVGCSVPASGDPVGTAALIQEADQRLYRAKHRGRNRVEPATNKVRSDFQRMDK